MAGVRAVAAWAAGGLLALAIAGCGRSAVPPASGGVSGVDGRALLLAGEPEGAAGVFRVRESAKDQEDVVVVGRIGGSGNPWIEGRAAFSIVDPELLPCSERACGDTCPRPWDYCCEDRLASGRVLVTFVDAEGRLIGQDARELFPVEELQTVVVRGRAARDEAENVTIAATGMFIRP